MRLVSTLDGPLCAVQTWVSAFIYLSLSIYLAQISKTHKYRNACCRSTHSQKLSNCRRSGSRGVPEGHTRTLPQGRRRRRVVPRYQGARLWCFCRQRPLAARVRGLTFLHSDSLPLASCSVYFAPHGYCEKLRLSSSVVGLKCSGFTTPVFVNLRSACVRCAAITSPLPLR